jgi:hypothetical protein
MNASAEEVAMTHTRQPRSCASATSLATSRAAGVAQAMTYKTRLGSLIL